MIQCQALNYLITKNDTSFLLLNNLTEEFFSDYVNEFRYIKEHFNNYGNIPDMASFVSKFPHFDVIEVNETSKYILEELYSDRNKRYLAKTFNKVRDLINNDKIEDAIAIYTTAAQDMVKAINLESVDIFEDTSRYSDYIDKCNEFKKYYIKTGFDELDKIIGGWDRNEELGTIVARPGIGKSWVLLKVAIAAAEQGLKVGLYSGEMSERKVGYRADTLISHISNGKIIHGDSSIQAEYKKYIDGLKDKFKGTIKVLTPAMINGPAGVTALRAFVEKENLDMLCVDQHSLLEDDRRARNPVEKAANISKDLKNLQVLKKIPIISVSQQNRTNADGGPDTSHVAASDRISQDSTVIVFLERSEDVLTLNLVKSRDSVNGKKIKYAADFNTGTFKYVPSENDGLDGEDCESIRQEFEECSEQGEDVF
jgi:replicative DNA helicase